MSNRQQHSDSPVRSTPSSSLEMEVADERDGVIRESSSTPYFRICHSRNLALVFLFVLAFFIAGTDIFESRDLALPDMDDDVTLPTAIMDENDEQDDGDDNTDQNNEDNDEDDNDEDEGEEHNVVDLNAKNPKRDGAEFISPTCNYTCRTDRLPHESPLYPGQVLCNQMYRFGMTDEGELFLQNCQLDIFTAFWSAKEEQLTQDQYPIHFEMNKNAYFQIISDPTGQVLFEKHPKRNITYHYMCLHSKPKLDCPYLHLHPDGVVALNWIDDDDGRWMVRDAKQQYAGLFPDKD